MALDLPIKLFVDCADPLVIASYAARPEISGFTTNPTLMRRAGVMDYATWAKLALQSAAGKPISFEVLADDQEEMMRQASIIAGWGENVYVKIPITTTKGEYTERVVHNVLRWDAKVNITAIMTKGQIEKALNWLEPKNSVILSIFAGRIADTMYDPVAIVDYASMAARQEQTLFSGTNTQVLWASTREIYNIADACRAHADIITVTPEILAKLPMYHRNLDELSLLTVKQFYEDAVEAGYQL